MLTPFQYLSSLITGFSAKFGTGVSAAIAAKLAPVAISCIGLYIALWALSGMRGTINEPWMDSIGRVIKIVFITTLALNAGFYNTVIAEAFPALMGDLISTISGAVGLAGISDPFKLLDSIYAQASSIFAEIWSLGGVTPWIVALVFMVPVVITLAVAVAIMAVATVGLKFMVAIGPIPVFLLLFEPTKSFFSNWLGQALNFVMTQVFAVMVLAMFGLGMNSTLKSMQSGLSASGGEIGLVDVFPILAFCIVMLYVLTKVTGWASGVVGGVETHLGQIVSRAIGSASGVMRGAGKLAGNATPANVAANVDKAKGNYQANKAAVVRFRNAFSRNKISKAA